jgi:hypothetical protein
MIIRLNKGLLWSALGTYLMLGIMGSQEIDPFDDAQPIVVLTLGYVVIFAIYVAAINCVYAFFWAIGSLVDMPIKEGTKEISFNILLGLSIAIPPVLTLAVFVPVTMGIGLTLFN